MCPAAAKQLYQKLLGLPVLMGWRQEGVWEAWSDPTPHMQVSAKEKSITSTSPPQEFILLSKLISYNWFSGGVSPSSWV